MRKFFAVLGVVFAIVVVAGGVFLAYASYRGRALDESSRAYVEANLPPILQSWSKDELLKRSSPQFLKIASSDPKLLDQLFEKLSKLGPLQHLGNIKGESKVFYNTKDGTIVGAEYTADAQFANGNAVVHVRLIQNAGEWRFHYFYVNSPIFLN